MSKKKQGKLIFFTQEHFISKLKLTRRECSEKEIQLIKETFESFGFDVEPYKDRKKEEIKKILEQSKIHILYCVSLSFTYSNVIYYIIIIFFLYLVENENYQDYNCLVIIVATHGTDGGWIYAKDGEYLDGIFEKTVANNESLFGKPKIILQEVSYKS